MNPFPRPLVLGHRGAPREKRENTLRSFARALEHGADGVELDVRRSHDRVAVVVHDDTLSRVFNVAGRVPDLPWPAIERLTSAELPSFEQVTAWAAASGAWLNVELKDAGVEDEAIRLIAERKLKERVVISSFDAAIVQKVGELDPSVRRFFLTKRWDRPALDALNRAGATGVCLHVDAASAAILEELDTLGLPVIAWTVNRPSRVRQLLRAGVAGIISDDPAMAAAERAAFLDG